MSVSVSINLEFPARRNLLFGFGYGLFFLARELKGGLPALYRFGVDADPVARVEARQYHTAPPLVEKRRRKSLVAARAIRAGEYFNETNLAVKRPGTGLSPMRWDEVVGRTAPRDFAPEELITL